MMSKQEKYAELFGEIETIIAEIEDENISVDELSEKVKRASKLIKTCRAVLHNTQKEVDDVLKDLKEENG